MGKRAAIIFFIAAGILFFGGDLAIRADAKSDSGISCGNYAIQAGDYIITSDKNGISLRSNIDNSLKNIVYGDDFYGGSIASDGKVIYYTCSGAGINRINVDGTEHNLLTETHDNPRLLDGTEKYLYYTDETSNGGYIEQKLNIYDLTLGQVVKSISNVNNVKIYQDKIYYNIARFDPEPVKFYVANLDGSRIKRISKKYCDSVFAGDEFYYLEFINYQKLRLLKSSLMGKNKEKQGKAFKSDLVIHMGEDYIYYIRTLNGKNCLYAHSLSTGTSKMLNSTDGYFSVVESDEGILYLRNTKSGLFFIIDGYNLPATHTQIKGNINVLGIFNGFVYYSKLDAQRNLIVYSVPFE